MTDVSSWVAVVVVLVVFYFLSTIFRGGPAYDPLIDTRAFIRTWNAEWESGEPSFQENGRITFLLDDRPVAVEFTGADDESGPTHTHFVAPLRGVNLRLELRPQWLQSSWVKLLKVEDIQVGSRHFDDAFYIQGSGPQQVREFLTPAVQEAIWKLARCGRYGRFDLRLQISGSQLLVTKQGRLELERDLSNLVESCQRLLRLIDDGNCGIEILERVAPRLASATECSVCGDPLKEKIVFCPKCKTPHHLDCWQYFGSCAVYGCGQKRYVHR